MAATELHTLWLQAAAELDGQIIFDVLDLDKRHVLDQVLSLAQERKNEVTLKQWKITKHNGRVVYLREIYENIVKCVAKFRDVVDVACQADAGHASLPWAGIRLLLQAAINEHERHKAVLEGMELASDLITRSAIIESLYLPPETSQTMPGDQLRSSLVALYTQILRFLTDAVHHYNKNGLARFGTSIVNPVETTLQKRIADIIRDQAVVDNLTRYVERSWSINKSNQAEENNATLQRMLNDMQCPINDIRSGLSLLLKHEEHVDDSTYLDWLSTIPYTQHHADIRTGRIQGTGQWLMQTDVFRDWKNSPTSSLFWLHGIPGCGKSRLVSAIIDNIKTQPLAPCELLSLAYVYFARDTAEKQRGDSGEALRSIARQLSLCLKRIQQLKHVYSTHALANASLDRAPRLTVASSLEYIQEITINTTTYIIIDALDECDQTKRSEMMRSLDMLINAPDRVIKIFVSSRDDGDIVRRLRGYPSLHISPDDNFQDIELFIDTKVDEYIAEGRLLQGHVSDELKHQIVCELKAGAQGMFLWVSLQLENLSNPERMIMEADVVAELWRLPGSLNELYASAHEQIVRAGFTSRHIAITTLKWLLCAQRPLNENELIAAVTVDHEENVISVSLEQVVASCRNLVLHDKNLNTLRFAHLSVRDFLEKQSGLSVSDSESVAAERCLDVVSATFSGVHVKGQKLQQNLDLKAYATTFWLSHYQKIARDKVPDRLEKKLFRFFFRGNDAFNSFAIWASKVLAQCELGPLDRFIFRDIEQIVHPPATPAFAACILGLPRVLAHLQKIKPADLDRCTIAGGSLLELATEYGQFDIVELLLSPSMTASTSKPLPLTEVMAKVDHDPSVLYYIAAVQAAVASQRSDVIAMLITRGKRYYGDIRLLDYALESAAWLGDSQMVSALLDNGAEVRNPRPGKNFDILAQATQNGMLNLVEHLLDNGADISSVSRDGQGMSAIEYAALNSYPDIIELLMERGASVFTSCMVQKWTAFHDAAAYDDVESLQALWDGMERGEGMTKALEALNMKNRYNEEAPLNTAIRNGAVHATKWLLAHGVQMLADREGYYPLDRAVLEGNLELIRMILTAENIIIEQLVRRPGKTGLTALHRAAYKGSTEICNEILQHDPGSVLIADVQGYTPIHVAALRGHVRIIDIFARRCHSDFLDLQNKWQMTPLMEAVANGHPEIVKILLEQGASPTISAKGDFLGTVFDSYNPFTGCRFTALHVAVAFQEMPCLEVLLEHGANQMTAEDFGAWLDTPDYFQRSAMELAMDIEDDMTTETLLANNKNVFGPDQDKMRADSRTRREPVRGSPSLYWSNKDLHPAARPRLPNNDRYAGLIRLGEVSRGQGVHF